MQYVNVVMLVLIGVVLVIVVYVIKRGQATKKIKHESISSPSIGNICDDFKDSVIAVKKVVEKAEVFPEFLSAEPIDINGIIVLYVMAKAEKTFAGYELLQILLSSGLRFGEMNIFHYYQDMEAQKHILFSLASATEPGVFDLTNMGNFSCKGLTLFMKQEPNVPTDNTRYEMMLKTAIQLSEDLDGLLLNGHKKLIKSLKKEQLI